MHGTKGNGFQQAVAFCRIQKVDDEHLGTIGIATISYHSCTFDGCHHLFEEFGIMIFLFKQERAFVVQCYLLSD